MHEKEKRGENFLFEFYSCHVLCHKGRKVLHSEENSKSQLKIYFSALNTAH
jgi:hypothetical protein